MNIEHQDLGEEIRLLQEELALQKEISEFLKREALLNRQTIRLLVAAEFVTQATVDKARELLRDK